MEKYAVAIQKQGLYAPTRVGDFVYVPDYGRHIWQGQIASTMEELAEQTNAAIKSVLSFGDPFQTIEVVLVEKGELVPDTQYETPRPRKLKVVGKVVEPGVQVGSTEEETCSSVQ